MEEREEKHNIIRNPLPFEDGFDASKVINLISDERSDYQKGLLTRFNALNRSVGKYFRFNKNVMIAGPEGVGKTLLVSMLIDDFTSSKGYTDKTGINLPPINGNIPNVIVAYFSFKHTREEEMIRMVAHQMNRSFDYLLSSQLTVGGYITLPDDDFKTAKRLIEHNASKSIIFIEKSGTIGQIYDTIGVIKNKYPNMHLVTVIDNLSAIERKDESHDFQLLSNISRTAAKIKKDFKSLNIFIHYTNDKMSVIDRRLNNFLHYPILDDVLGSKQATWAMDDVFIMNRPETLNIAKYGPEKIKTTRLLHLVKVKNSFGPPGSIWFKTYFENSHLDHIKWKELLEENKSRTNSK